MTFEITVGSADDVQRMARWADDEGWNPGNTDTLAFFAADPGAFLIGRLDGEPVVCISVVKYGAALRLPGLLHRPAAGARQRATASRSGAPAWRGWQGAMSGSTAWWRSRPTTASRASAPPGTTSATRERRLPLAAARGCQPARCARACRSTSSPPTTAASFPRRAIPSWRRGSRCPNAPRWWRCATASWRALRVMRACQAASRVGPAVRRFAGDRRVAGLEPRGQDRCDGRGDRHARHQQAGHRDSPNGSG